MTLTQKFTKLRVNIEFEATRIARKLANAHYAEGKRREDAELKQCLIQAGNEELARYNSLLHYESEYIRTNEEKQQWAIIFGRTFYNEYNARYSRLCRD